MKRLLETIGQWLFALWTLGVMGTYFYFYQTYGLFYLNAIVLLLFLAAFFVPFFFFASLPFAFRGKTFPPVLWLRRLPKTIFVPIRSLVAVFYGCVASWIALIFLLKPDRDIAENSVASVLLVTLITLAGFSIGSALIRRFHIEYESFLERFILATLLGFGVLMLIVYGLGMTGLLYSTLAYMLVLGALFFFRKEWLALFREIQKTSLPWRVRPFFTFDNFAIIASFILFVFATTGLLSQFAAGWDEMHTYQAFPKAYAEAHAIVNFPYWFTSGFPKNMEMLFTLAHLLKGFTPAAGMNTVFYFLLPGILVLLKRLVFPKASSTVVVLLYALSAIPYLMITIDHKIDLAFWCYTLLATLYLLKFFETQNRKIFLLSCILMGIAAGTKYNFFSIILPSFLIVLLFFPHTFNFKKRLANIAICLTIIAALFSPWAVKNIIFSGNPVEPALGDLLSRDDTFFKQIGRSYSEHIQEHFSDANIWAENQEIKDWKFYATLPFRLTFNYKKENFHDVINIGPLYLLSTPFLFFLLIKNIWTHKKILHVLISIIFFQFILWIFLSNFLPHYIFQNLLLFLIFFTAIVNTKKNKLFKISIYVAIFSLTIATIIARFDGTFRNSTFFTLEKNSDYPLYETSKFINNKIKEGLIWNHGVPLNFYVKYPESKIIFDPYLSLFYSFCSEGSGENLIKKMKSLNVSAFIFDESSAEYWINLSEKATDVSPKTSQKFQNSEKCYLKFKNQYLSRVFHYENMSIYIFK